MEIVGVIVAICGWVFLIGFVGADAGYGRDVVNLHLVQIANNVIHLGYFIVFCGIISRSFKAVTTHLSGVPEMRAAYIKKMGTAEMNDAELAVEKKAVAAKKAKKTASKINDEELERLSVAADNAEDADSINEWKRSTS